MKTSRRCALGGAAAMVAAMSGCASPPAHYYRLAPVAGAVRNGGPATIGVRSVDIPGYLDQNGIAKPGGGYEFATYDNELWAEPLAAMLQAVMVQDLAQRLPGSIVIGSGGSIAAPAGLLVEINVLRFDADNSGQIILSAQIAVRAPDGGSGWLTRNFQAGLAPAGPAVADIVAAMSALWGQAADLAGTLLTS